MNKNVKVSTIKKSDNDKMLVHEEELCFVNNCNQHQN